MLASRISRASTGLQDKAWYYIELFYNEQGAEDSGYVTESYLEALARQITGLNFNKWMADGKLASLVNEVRTDNAAGTGIDGDEPSTPIIAISGTTGRPGQTDRRTPRELGPAPGDNQVG